MYRLMKLVTLTALITPAVAGDLPVSMQGKLLSIISRTCGGNGKVDCQHDPALAKGFGENNDPSSKFAWGTNEAQIKALRAQNKLVICPKVELLSKGAAIAIVEEDGKPAIYVHLENLKSSGVVLNDAFMKMSKKL